MLWFAAGAWLLLAVVLGARLVHQRDRVAREAGSPASLTGVAGTAVLGTRLAMQDYHVAAVALLAVSCLGWALLLMPVLRRWQAPTLGIAFVLCVATAGLAVVWLFPLIAGEVLRPRLSYDVRRWATVFPLGMYAACSFTVGQVTRITGIAGFGHVWTWVAFTVSLLVLAGLFRHGWAVLRGQHRRAAGSGELQGHAGERGAISEQPVLDLDIVGRRVCRARLLVVEIAARHPCVRIRADGQPCLGHRGE
jgi:tellurite resistance protein TehA-like permease